MQNLVAFAVCVLIIFLMTAQEPIDVTPISSEHEPTIPPEPWEVVDIDLHPP